MNDWIKPYVKAHKGLLILTILFGVGALIAACALLFTSGYLISKSSLRPENILLVYVPIVLVRAFGISRPVLNYLQQLASHSFVLAVLSKMRVRLFQRLETQALVLKERYAIGDLLGLLADDLEHLQNFYLKTIFPALFALILYGIAIIALGVFSIPYALLLALLFGILVFVLPYVALKRNRQHMLDMKIVRAELYNDLTDAVMGATDWKLSGRADQMIAGKQQIAARYDRLEAKIEASSRRRSIVFQVVAAASVILLVMFGSDMAQTAVFHPMWIAAFVLVALPLLEAFMPISDAISHFPSYDTSFARLMEVEGRSEDAQPCTTLPTGPYTVDISNVAFQYDNRTVLRDVSMTWHPHQKVAILGKTGTGKSTLGKLLLGAYKPTAGTVTINGVHMHTLRHDTSQLIAVLEQKPYLFDTTIMNNIRLGNVSASDAEVIEAAKKVQLHEMIETLPHGYDTRVEELGTRFSGGERQRIALARILLQQTPIVLLDEPTVGLDPVTEQELIHTIFEVLSNKTVVWITHHLAAMAHMDTIYMLENGRVRVKGSHEQLLADDARYRKLYDLDYPFD